MEFAYKLSAEKEIIKRRISDALSGTRFSKDI